MKVKLYSIRDLKSEFWSPRVAYDDDSAIRDFSMQVSNPEPYNALNFAPSDFELYFIGDFDSRTGMLEPIGLPAFVARGDSCLKKVGDIDAE